MTVTDPRSVPLVRELLLAHAYWRLRGFRADLIILNQEIPSYDRPLHQQLLRQIEAHSPADSVNRPGGVYLRDWHAMTEEHRNLILAAASVVLSGNRGPLQQQLATARETVMPPPFVPSGGQEEPSPPLPFLELPYFNGLGGFTPDGREYAIYLKPGSQTPVPWVNVMANSKFGALVSESGIGFTWSGNSQSNRLTPWHNDPVSDPQSEVIYLRDDESGAVWTPTALPIREQDAYRARHGQGSTVFEHNSHAIGQELTVFVPTSGGRSRRPREGVPIAPSQSLQPGGGVSPLPTSLNGFSARTVRTSSCTFTPLTTSRPARCWRPSPGLASVQTILPSLRRALERLHIPAIGRSS